ncbi:MAG: TetR/AcrR family transcriptional regulator [Psychromonas sp.]
MTQRKQGRRTAEESQRTKLTILTSAAYLFCQHGYNQVSIRDISERAGVTHSLVRHYFGAKNQIWFAIIEIVHENMTLYSAKLAEQLSDEISNSQRLYLFLAHLMAYVLKKPQLVQLMMDYIHHPENEVEQIDTNDGEMRSNTTRFVDLSKSTVPKAILQHSENSDIVMWKFLIHAGGTVAFKPFIAPIWPDLSHEQCLFAHWKLFENQIAYEYQVTNEFRLKGNELDDIVLDIKVLDEETQALFDSHSTNPLS